jgi:hypothetical protein
MTKTQRTNIPALAKAKTCAKTSVWHVGTMNSADKRTDSHEGNGLSVSLHPQEWTQIARLRGGSRFKLSKVGARFLDFHALTKEARIHLELWGITLGWLQHEPRWEVQWHDSEAGGIRKMLCGSEDSAKAEVADREDDDYCSMKEVKVPCLTEQAVTRLGFKIDPLGALDIAATFYVEDETDLNGIWWSDTLDPESLSAPRGVINLKLLPTWTTKLEHGPVSR